MDNKEYEFSAKDVDLAESNGLSELNLTRDQVEIEVLDKGGLFRQAKIKIIVKDDPLTKAQIFLQEFLDLIKLPAYCETNSTDEEDVINIVGADMSKLLVNKGEAIDALQYLTSLIANNNAPEYRRIVLDTEDYRLQRQEHFEKLADKMAEKAISRGFRIKLEPMNPYERRIIHTRLADNDKVETYSEGEEPNRYVVISVIKSKEYRPSDSYEGKFNKHKPYDKNKKFDHHKKPFNGNRKFNDSKDFKSKASRPAFVPGILINKANNDK